MQQHQRRTYKNTKKKKHPKRSVTNTSTISTVLWEEIAQILCVLRKMQIIQHFVHWYPHRPPVSPAFVVIERWSCVL